MPDAIAYGQDCIVENCSPIEQRKTWASSENHGLQTCSSLSNTAVDISRNLYQIRLIIGAACYQGRLASSVFTLWRLMLESHCTGIIRLTALSAAYFQGLYWLMFATIW